MKCPFCSREYDICEGLCPYCGRQLPVPNATVSDTRLLAGTVLRGRYEINEEPPKARGQGCVYFAIDMGAEGKPCVVKQVRQRVTSDGVQKKLREEAKRMAALSQAIGGRMPEIIEDFVDDGYFYLVQQRIFGKDLEEVFNERQPLREKEVVGWAVQCCKILQSIHDADTVHRDISPDNIMLTKMGDIMFIDFGTLRELQSIAQGARGMGKFGYAPREQWADNPVPQSDIFALGATIYFLLTGFLPLSEKAKAGGDPQPSDLDPSFPPIRTKSPNVSVELEKILSRALRSDISERYQSAKDMRTELERLVAPEKRKVNCPECGKPNDADLVYCISSTCHTRLYPETRQCFKCHRDIPINANFCPKCGKQQPSMSVR